MRITKQKLAEGGVFVVFIGSLHFMYYKMQQNSSLIPPDQRTELFYVRWIKNTFPSLGNKIGIDDSERIKRDEEFRKKREAGITSPLIK